MNLTVMNLTEPSGSASRTRTPAPGPTVERGAATTPGRDPRPRHTSTAAHPRGTPVARALLAPRAALPDTAAPAAVRPTRAATGRTAAEADTPIGHQPRRFTCNCAHAHGC
ncbi:hypothetical protein RVR_5426 [Actinacidiphila reveromycinica]|uniref:Uncharacterized protein n=1 Tax=Actinacidiphila reveromycinica TaxID=659352 RepID=A0A7U3VPR6_9ACTN|nr:hypothetical protein RVR_5426 [Streptomyces sp. SN-593]